MSSELLRRPVAPGPDGLVQSIEPAPPAWTWSTFRTYSLDDGGRIEDTAADAERLLLVLEGHVSVRLDGRYEGSVGTRASVFDGPPAGVVLVAPGVGLEATAVGRALVVLAAAPAGPVSRTAVLRPDEILVEHRGAGGTARRVHHLLAPGAEAGRLIAFEVFTPAGNWSSFPPHKHDKSDLPAEAELEELYYFKVSPPRGFGMIRVYDDAHDDVYVLKSDDVVTIPGGYHPVAVVPGHRIYYLWALAGRRDRVMAPRTHPDFV